MNIYEIAEKAGVSIATVSRVINKKGNVRKSTLDRITKIIEGSGYIKKSEIRRRLSNTIAIICSSIDDSISAATANYICRKLNMINYRAELICSGNDMMNKRNILNRSMSGSHLGMVILGSNFFSYSDEDNVSMLPNINIPAVSINGFCESSTIKNVENNISESISGIVSGYLKKNMQKILLVLENMSAGSKEFLKGYKDAFFLCNTETSPDYIQVCKDAVSAEKYVNRLINKSRMPEVIISNNDYIAAHLILHLSKKGFNIPKDIEITGCGNTPLCNLVSPSLSSFDLKLNDLCDTAVKTLTGMINNEEVPDINIITPEFIKRESTVF